MKLGAFSLSLAVKDIEVSKVFYQNLGFEVFGGDQSQNWLIMRNEDKKIGLFQGMFDKNLMTFNPGWDNNCNTLESFDDVREIHNKCQSDGVEITSSAIEKDSGPASFFIADPDGNVILFDQHV